MMKNIKTHILVNFFVSATLIIAAITTVVSWQLSKSVTAQTREMSHHLQDDTHSALLSHVKVFNILFENIKKEVSGACREVISNTGVKAGIEFGLYESVDKYLKTTCRIKNLDYALFFNTDGQLLASFPEGINVEWMEARFQKSLTARKPQHLITKEVHTPNAPIHIDICHEPVGFLKETGLTYKDPKGKGALAVKAIGHLQNDEGETICTFITGRLLNQYHEPLKQLHEVTGSVAAIFIDTVPIAYGGFPSDLNGLINDENILLTSTFVEGFGDEDLSNSDLKFNGTPYLSTSKPIECNDAGIIGNVLIGLPEENVLSIQNEHLERELTTKRRVQTWTLGVGIFALVFFVFQSLLLANQVTKPITEAKEQLEIQVKERTSELSTAYDKLKVTVNQLRAAKDYAEEANRAKSDFLANMSHELRTPLNHIIGFTELIVAKHFGDLNSSQEEYLNDVLSSSHHLLTLVNDILDLAKVEAGKLELQRTPVDLKQLLETSLTMVKEKALKHSLTVSIDVGELPNYLEMDERKIKQVVYNLLSNAVKFTPDGGRISLSAHFLQGTATIPSKITDSINFQPIGPDENKEWVKISVKDNGIGIDKNNLDKIFSPFEQVESSRSRQFQGTGLGLSLVKELIVLHKGQVWAESEGIDSGTTISFIIPAHVKSTQDTQQTS